MPDPTNATRQRRWRARQAGLLPPMAACRACGVICDGTHGLVCSRCWERLTPEGRADRAARVRRVRERKKR